MQVAALDLTKAFKVGIQRKFRYDLWLSWGWRELTLPSDVAFCYADVVKMRPSASSLAHTCVWKTEPRNGQLRRITFWPPGIHMLSSQEHHFLTEIPWADPKQAGTSSQHDGRMYRETRLFWRAREPHQHGLWPSPASFPSCLAWLQYHTDTTTFLQVLELPWASPQGAASRRVEALTGITV